MRLLTVKSVSEVLGVSEARVYDLIREGILPACRLGRQVRVSEDVLREWIENGGQALPGGWRRDAEVSR